MKYVIIYSGGMDSTVLLHEYKEQILLAVNFNYGSKHNQMEYYSAKEFCKKLSIPFKRIDLDFTLFKSSILTGGGTVPKGHYEDYTMKSTVVPFRNGIMISYAAGIAESIGAEAIIIANHFGDHAIYPDCREEFITAMNKAVKTGTYKNILLISPYNKLTKRQIALRGKELNVKLEDTYSCYNGESYHCGECGTYVERKEALEGFDNTVYIK